MATECSRSDGSVRLTTYRSEYKCMYEIEQRNLQGFRVTGAWPISDFFSNLTLFFQVSR